MKRIKVVLLGLIVVMLCVMPAMAKKPVDTEEDIFSGVVEVAASIPPDPSRDMVTAEIESIPASIDTQTPVLDGSAYTNYDTIFVHGVNAISDESNDYDDIVLVEHFSNGIAFMLRPKTSSDYPWAFICCPIPSYQLKTGGVQPRVRYIAVEHKSDTMSLGHAWPEVYKVDVYNGHVKIKTIDTTFSSPSYTVQIIDLGGWYAFDRGLNLALFIRNGVNENCEFGVFGYGARFEW